MGKQILNTKLANKWVVSKKERFDAVTFDAVRPLTFKEILRKYRIGLYCAAIASMLLIIFLLAYKINSLSKNAGQFVVLNMLPDVPIQPKDEVPVDPKEELAKEVDEMIRNARSTSVRNVIVNTDDAQRSVLRDDKGINSSVYDEAQRLQEKLDANRRQQEAYQSADNAVPVKAPEVRTATETYKGPSVLSYALTGRSAITLPIPAYMCERGGDVVVIIQVNRRGYVVGTKVDTRRSAADPAMRDAAEQAAKTSRFTPDNTAAEPQQGEIVYRFIAQ